ncbi:MAG: AAA family ATPase [Leadbetterella sp.]
MIVESISLRNIPENPIFPFTLDLIKNLETIRFSKNITFLVGENGSGKSTLLEAFAYASEIQTVGSSSIVEDELMQPARDLGKMLSLRYGDKSRSGFFTRAEDFLGFVKHLLNQIKELDAEIQDIEQSWTGGDLERALAPIKQEKKAYTDRYTQDLNAMSHGEGFLHFFKARIAGKGLFLIDEPEAALSPQRQLSLIILIREAVKNFDSQFIIATHSPIMFCLPEAEILHVSEGKITSVNFTELDHYSLTKSILENPKVYYEQLGRE